MQLRVITDSDRTCLGIIEAQVGIRLANGYTISKVHPKSVVAECNGHTDKFFPPESIFYTEAVRWGFSHPTVDENAENEAAITRKFRHGEAAHQQYINYGYAPALADGIEEAGFAFAKLVEAHRKSAIAQLEEAGVEVNAKV